MRAIASTEDQKIQITINFQNNTIWQLQIYLGSERDFKSDHDEILITLPTVVG
jgi:hypothetical protein